MQFTLGEFLRILHFINNFFPIGGFSRLFGVINNDVSIDFFFQNTQGVEDHIFVCNIICDSFEVVGCAELFLNDNTAVGPGRIPLFERRVEHRDVNELFFAIHNIRRYVANCNFFVNDHIIRNAE